MSYSVDKDQTILAEFLEIRFYAVLPSPHWPSINLATMKAAEVKSEKAVSTGHPWRP